MNPRTNESTARARRTRVQACMLAFAAVLVAGTAHAGTAELTDSTLRGLLAYFADPEHVRGVLGAALGAIVSVVAAQTVSGASAEDPDDR